MWHSQLPTSVCHSYQTTKASSFEPESNQRPKDFSTTLLQSSALPAELSKGWTPSLLGCIFYTQLCCVYMHSAVGVLITAVYCCRLLSVAGCWKHLTADKNKVGKPKDCWPKHQIKEKWAETKHGSHISWCVQCHGLKFLMRRIFVNWPKLSWFFFMNFVCEVTVKIIHFCSREFKKNRNILWFNYLSTTCIH